MLSVKCEAPLEPYLQQELFSGDLLARLGEHVTREFGAVRDTLRHVGPVRAEESVVHVPAGRSGGVRDLGGTWVMLGPRSMWDLGNAGALMGWDLGIAKGLARLG